MALSNDLKTMFAKITNDQPEDKKESIAYGKIVKDGDTDYVQLDGSELLTPISSTTVVNDGDRVMVTIKNHTAIVTGDFTNPSANDKDVKEIGNKITEFEIVIADKVTTEQLEAEVGRIDKLISDTVEATDAKFETIDAKVAEIDTIKADNVEINKKLSAHEGEFETIRSDIADFKDVTADSIEAIEGEFNTLSSNYAKFEETYTGKIEANEGKITELETKKLDTETANATFANIDFSNIDIATMGQFFADSGIIENVVIKDGNVTGQLVGVTIKGDLIEGGTVVADKLVILGTDGLYYKLNTNGESVTSQQTEYNSLNGSIITAKSVTADKIKVTDLVAFGATIGGYHINDHALYSGSKASINNTTDGIFLGDDGQINIGNANNFLKFYKDQNGNYKLEIRTSEFIMSSGTSVETAINNVDTKVDNIQVGGRNLLIGTNNGGSHWAGNKQNGEITKESTTALGVNAVKFTTVTPSTGWQYLFYSNVARTKLKAGGTYTLSFDIHPSVDINVKPQYCQGDSSRSCAAFTTKTASANTWTKYVNTVTFNDTDPNQGQGIYINGTNKVGTYIIANLKLEEGNKATTWTPAPEDIDADINSVSGDLTNYINTTNAALKDMQGQIDGSIMTWFYEVVPTTENMPAVEWTTTELKNNHLGDLYYDTITGYCYRWQVQNNTYSWNRITDVDVTKALADAKNAQDTADNKRRVFTTTPTTPYDVGDLWVQGTSGDILRCSTAKTAQQSYLASDWTKASKYTDDSKVNAVDTRVNLLTGDATNYCQLNDSTASYFKFTADNTADGHWYTMNTIARDRSISDYYECSGGEILSIDCEMSTSCQARLNSTAEATANIGYASSAIGVFCYDDNGAISSGGYLYSTRVKASAEAPATKISSTVTIPSNARKFKLYVQTEAWNSFTGTIKIRNVRVRKLAVQSTDVEYYLSTSNTALSGGSWSTTAPAWVDGKYMWSRTKTVLQNGTTKYSPSENGTCIAGAKGATGATGATGADGTSYYVHVKYSNDNIKFTGNNGNDIGSFMGVCTTTSSTAPTTFNSYQWSKTSDWAGKDKWRVDVYTRTNINNSSTVPTPADYESETLVKSFLINDSQSTTWGYGDDFLAKVIAYVYCDSDFTFTSNYKSDDASSVYLNDEKITNSASCAVTSVTLNFKKGWNKICLLMNEQSGEEYAYFSTKLSTHNNVVFMTAYEEDMIKVGEQGVKGDKGDTGEAAPIPKSVDAASGNPVIVEDAGNLPLKTLSIEAKTEQETRSGKNLFDNRNLDTSITNKGLTSVLNDDGSITVTGISTANYPAVVNGKEITNILEDGTAYTISQTEKSNSFYMQIVRTNISDNTKTYMHLMTSNSYTFTVDKSQYTYSVGAQLGAMADWGTTSRTITQKFQLEKGSTATEFEKYGASPSPEFPSEVKTVKGVTNLLNYTDESKWIKNSDYITVIDNGIRVPIKNNNNMTYQYGGIEFPNINENLGKTFTISCNCKVTGSNTPNINLYWLNGTALVNSFKSIGNGTGGTFTLPETLPSGVTNLVILFYSNTGSTSVTTNDYAEFTNILLEEGSVKHKYVPYGRWIEVKSIGKNLLNTKLIERNKSYGYGVVGLVPTGNTNNTRAALSVENAILIKPNTTYSLTIPNGHRVAIAQLESNLKSLGDTGWLTTNTYKLTTKSNAKYVGFNFSKADSSVFTDDDWNNFINGDLQFELKESTEYEPYKESTGLLDMNKPNLLSNNPSDWERKTSDLMGDNNSTTRIKVKNYIKVNSNNKYRISLTNSKYCFINIDMYNANKTLIDSYYNIVSHDINGTRDLIIKFPTEVKYVKPTIRNADDVSVITPDEIVDINPSLYDYDDPYYEFVELPNGVADEPQNGKLIKKVGRVILDGTQTTEALGAVGPNGEKRFSVTIPGMKTLPTTEVGCVSDKYLGIKWSQSAEIINSVSIWDQNNILCITTDSTTMTVDQFKQQLAEDPVTVWYELVEPEEYDLNYTSPTLHEGYNHITLNDDLNPNIDIEYYTHFKGTGVASITEEYYLSTSKTAQTGGSWVTTAPTWSSGKYIWTRSKIVYSNPESVEYTTPVCDNSWEVVNEIEIGGRNLFIKKNLAVYNVDSWVWNGYTLSCICSKGSSGPRFSSSLFTVGEIYVLSFKFKKTGGTLKNIGGHANGFTQQAFYLDGTKVSSRYIDGHALNDTTDTHTVSVILKYHGTDGADNNLYIQVNRQSGATPANFDLWDIKLEKGNKPTDWTPAPEDTITELANLQTQVDGKIQTYNQTSDPSTTWTTTELKTTHTGDLWYNSSTKKTQMWSGTAWVNIENAEAQAAATLAGKKAQIFTSQPTVPYYKGDLWITSLNEKSGIVKTCKTTRTSGSYTASEWIEGLKYTDDTAVNNLSIGGRNLIINSNFAKGLNQPARDATNKISGWMTPTSNSEISDDVKFNNHNTLYRHRTGTTAVSWTENQYYYYRPDNEKSIDTSYVLTFWVYATNIDWINSTNTIASAIRLRDENNAAVGEVSIRDIRPTKANEWQKVECKFTIEASKNCDWFYIFDSPSRDFDYYLADYKLEIGNKSTDWSPAPEDMENSLTDEITEVNETIVEYETTLRNSNEEYFNEHIANYVTKDALTGEIQSVESKVSAVTKTAEDLTLSFTTTTTDLSGKIDAINNTLAKYFVFDDDGLTIKAGPNEMQIRVDNDIIIFSRNGQDFGSWDGIDFRTGNIYVDVSKRAQFGNYAYVPRSDGSLMLLKVK